MTVASTCSAGHGSPGAYRTAWISVELPSTSSSRSSGTSTFGGSGEVTPPRLGHVSDPASQVRVGPGADDAGGPRRLIFLGEQVVGAFQRHEAARMAGGTEDLARVADADGVV